jgi:hypothetical protein
MVKVSMRPMGRPGADDDVIGAAETLREQIVMDSSSSMSRVLVTMIWFLQATRGHGDSLAYYSRSGRCMSMDGGRRVPEVGKKRLRADEGAQAST